MPNQVLGCEINCFILNLIFYQSFGVTSSQSAKHFKVEIEALRQTVEFLSYKLDYQTSIRL